LLLRFPDLYVHKCKYAEHMESRTDSKKRTKNCIK
jgi:hypothetical protein